MTRIVAALPELFIGLTWITAAVIAFAAARAARWTAGNADVIVAQFAWSFAFPAGLCALLMPITSHLLAALIMGVTAQTFSNWIFVNAPAAAAAHMTFAVLYAARVHALASNRKPLSKLAIFLLTCVAANVPTPLHAMPVVALTGLPILLLMSWAEQFIARERHALLQPDADVPTAALLHR